MDRPIMVSDDDAALICHVLRRYGTEDTSGDYTPRDVAEAQDRQDRAGEIMGRLERAFGPHVYLYLGR